jgi:hypothetical protein
LKPDQRFGNIAAHLAMNFPQWVERRVEHVSYLDEDTTRWSEGLMIRWPAKSAFRSDVEPNDGELIYVPLDLLTKHTLVGLDGLHPDGSPVPILPFSRSCALASAGITWAIWSRSVQQEEGALKPQTIKTIDAIVRSPPDLARVLVTRALHEPGQLSELLKTRDQVRALLEQLAGDVMFLAPAVYRPGKESVYRYTYCQSLPRKDSLPARLAVSFGYRDAIAVHERLSLGRSGSYHFEVDAPPELKIPRARLYGKYGPKKLLCPVAEGTGSPVIDLHARRPTEKALTTGEAMKPKTRPPVLPAIAEDASFADVLGAADAAKSTPVELSDEGEAEIRFRLRPSGMFMATMLVSVLTAGLLLAALTRLEQLDGQTAATLVLALPIVVLGYLNRPGEHTLATRLLIGVRAASVVIGICSLLIAGILAGGYIRHQPLASPDVACRATTGEQPTMNTHTHDPDGEEPLLAGLKCKPGKRPPSATTFSRAMKTAAQIITWVAVFLAAVLLTGWLSTAFRPRKLLPTSVRDHWWTRGRVRRSV